MFIFIITCQHQHHHRYIIRIFLLIGLQHLCLTTHCLIRKLT